MTKKGAFEGGGTGLVVAIILILIVVGIMILFSTGKLSDLFESWNLISPEKEKVDTASCVIACNTEKNLARIYSSCKDFRDEQFNEQDSRYCRLCVDIAECEIIINNEQCYCAYSDESDEKAEL